MTDCPGPISDPSNAARWGWLAAALDPSIIRRAIVYALLVGAILIAINHGDAIMAGDVTPIRLVKMGLTAIVPYLVSTCSSVGALRRAEETRRAAAVESA